MKRIQDTMYEANKLIEQFEGILAEMAFQINECQREVKQAQNAHQKAQEEWKGMLP